LSPITIVDTELLGTIPTEIALLQKLETLHIGESEFHSLVTDQPYPGNLIHSSMSYAAGLVERAEIPSEIGNLEFLDTLKLGTCLSRVDGDYGDYYEAND
jgi:hypothetical protein